MDPDVTVKREIAFPGAKKSILMEEFHTIKFEKNANGLKKRFSIKKSLGKGAFGEVWEAFDNESKKDVALKILKKKSSNKKFTEGMLHAELNHPNITKVFDHDLIDNLEFISMEIAPGKALDSHIRFSNLTETEILKLASDLIIALEYAHSRGVIHRDIKPGNIIYNQKPYSLLITDFGVSENYRIMKRKISQAGTYLFMAPEQLCGRVTPASDFWAVGVTLYLPAGPITLLKTTPTSNFAL